MSAVRYANVTCQYPGAERPSVTAVTTTVEVPDSAP